MRKIILTLIIGYLTLGSLAAQKPVQWNAAEIHEAIKKLNFLGSALYVAAHPDDENTRLIAYLANDVKANTAYLSLTRGDGGQNLVGKEIRELLGVIRTQELLAARRVDGGKQFFSRANDFGYSKNPDETLNIWNKEAVMADVIWTIRKWQPDIIVNRFNHETGRRTHGHHTTSAMLSVEAFDLANDPNVYPEQLEYVQPWQPKRIFFNTSWWFYGSREKFKEADKSRMMAVDVGTYYPKLGKSNTEIASASRSMHKSQGFGSTGTRGMETEYLQLIKGEMPSNKIDLFEGINTSWTRIEGGKPIGDMLAKVEAAFDYEDPSKSIPLMIEAYKMIQALPDGYWKRIKSEELKQVIKACMGLYIEAVADDYSAAPGENTELELEVINRSDATITLKNIQYLPVGLDSTLTLDLDKNQIYEFYHNLALPTDLEYSTPYWLNTPWQLGMYEVEDQLQRGLPETPRKVAVKWTFEILGTDLEYTTEVVFKRNDPVDGEVYRPFEILPPVFANIEEPVYIFPNDKEQEVIVTIKAGKEGVRGTLSLDLPEGWTAQPALTEFILDRKGEEQNIAFQLKPPAAQSEGAAKIKLEVGGNTYDKSLTEIIYDHIPAQTVLLEGSSRIVRIDLEKAGEQIGYIMGAGDVIPESLEQIGYEVTILEDGDISVENLKNFDAIILGVRAYNTNDRMKFHQPKLLDYVKQGGTLIVQYNTSFRLKVPSEELAPYPLKLSRDRVTVEEAEVRFLKPDHPVLNFPNKITQKDFDGWVQERGLYFPNEWSDEFDAILSSNDPGEEPKDGGLLVAQYGSGYYIYSGYSWFRELPAGVPGAFRIFTNLISIGKQEGK